MGERAEKTGSSPKTSYRTVIAAISTIVWIIIISVYCTFRSSEFVGVFTNPHDLAEFIAGVVGPVALLWLVVGYFQQGEELELQRAELALQRKETARLADEATKQAASIGNSELHARRQVFLMLMDMNLSNQIDLTLKLYKKFRTVHSNVLNTWWTTHANGNKNIFFQSFINDVIYSHDFRESFQGPYVPAASIVEQFVDNFEFLHQLATECDPDKTIIRNIEFSTMGTIYIAFCIINSRESKMILRPKPSSMNELLEQKHAN